MMTLSAYNSTQSYTTTKHTLMQLLQTSHSLVANNWELFGENLNHLNYNMCLSRAPDEEDGPFAGVQDSQEVCTTSFSTSPPSQVRGHPSLAPLYGLFLYPVTSSLHSYLFFISTFPFLSLSVSFLLSFYCMFMCVCVSALSQCVCTLSPSPSKLSKPLPLDSLQLPLAPGLVTHTVSLYWPLWECDCAWYWSLKFSICFGVYVAPRCVRVACGTLFNHHPFLAVFKLPSLISVQSSQLNPQSFVINIPSSFCLSL